MSSTMINCAGYCDDFCGAKAHSGMAKVAKGLSTKSGPAIVERLNELADGYKFIICGHSLGAGVAGPVNLLVYYEEMISTEQTV